MPRLLDVRLPISVRAPGIAREEMQRFASTLHERQQEDLVLLVSELVTNSVVHAVHTTDSIRLRAWAVETAVRVCVIDSGPGFAPDLVVPESHEEGHRGLWLLDLLADTWGISADGKTSSWFEMRGRPAPESSPVSNPVDQFLDAIAEWPIASRELAWCMAASLGPPVDVVANRLTWTTPECVATILCPDHHATPEEPRRRGLVEGRNGRWWLETIRNHQHQPPAGNPAAPTLRAARLKTGVAPSATRPPDAAGAGPTRARQGHAPHTPEDPSRYVCVRSPQAHAEDLGGVQRPASRHLQDLLTAAEPVGDQQRLEGR